VYLSWFLRSKNGICCRFLIPDLRIKTFLIVEQEGRFQLVYGHEISPSCQIAYL